MKSSIVFVLAAALPALLSAAPSSPLFVQTDHGFDLVPSSLPSVQGAVEAVSTAIATQELPANHGILDFSEFGTIADILNATLHHHRHGKHAEHERPHWKTPETPGDLPLHRLAWLVNRSTVAIEDLSKEGITLLAPDDWALTPPHRQEHHGKHGEHHKQMRELRRAELAAHQPLEHPFHSDELREAYDSVDEGDDRRARFAKIIAYVLRYHTLPFAATEVDLADHSTLPTTAASGYENKEPLRVRVAPTYQLHPLPHPTLEFNFYSQKRGYTILASNGVIHMVSAPLLPPFSPLSSLFLFPQAFSTLTSGLQKVDLADTILPPRKELETAEETIQQLFDEIIAENGGQWTVFAPTNFAFTRLGPKIIALLHSPFPISRRILKYVLSYHLVPDLAFYSDYIHNTTSLSSTYEISSSIDVDITHSGISFDSMAPPPPPHFGWNLPGLPGWARRAPGPGGASPSSRPSTNHRGNVTSHVLPTLLSSSGVNSNATLLVDVVSYRLFGKGHIRRAVVVRPHPREHEDESLDGSEHEEAPVVVFKADAVARNGAIHVINTILRPPYYHHEEKSSMANGLNALFEQ